MHSDITLRLAEYAAATGWDDLPPDVQHQAQRTLINWTGAAIGGASHPAIDILVATAQATGAIGTTPLFGRGERLTVPDAAMLNCVASAVDTFDDTHLDSISHPGGPVVATVMALARDCRSTGAEALAAITIGIEVACRLGNMLIRPPARGDVGLFMTSVTGGVGAAVAAARLLGLDVERTATAMGIAAAQACGLRDMHGTMTSSFMCGHAARCGLVSAMLAQRGFTASLTGIEGEKGLARLFSREPDLGAALGGLGEQFEFITLAFKPYPCGVAAFAAIEAALDCKSRHVFGPSDIAACSADVHPVALALMWRQMPADALQAQVSVYHWIAAALATGRAGRVEGQDEAIKDYAIAALRRRIVVTADPQLTPDAARLRVTLRNGREITSRIDHAMGSASRPLTDHDIETKFRALTEPVLGPDLAKGVLAMCRAAESLEQVAVISDACGTPRGWPRK